MTLSDCHTTTIARRADAQYDEFKFGDQLINSASHGTHKIFRHVDMLRQELGLSGRLYITSDNTFPAGCGIASSASGFAALTLATVAALTGHHDWSELSLKGYTRERLAHWARRGSGSAGRSLFGGFTKWSAGASASEQMIAQVHPHDHWNLSDIVVVLSAAEKPVSSTEAHIAAWGSPLFAPRVAGIPSRMDRVLSAIGRRDILQLGDEIECEALDMHAVAMTGEPPINFLLPDTVTFISWVRMERRRGTLPAWFTIDAGPNVHLICESKEADAIQRRIRREFPNAKVIADRIGQGPTLARELPDAGGKP